ncbi:hypothetical protein BKA93DRAFT_749414 [Sparassis latifolia]
MSSKHAWKVNSYLYIEAIIDNEEEEEEEEKKEEEKEELAELLADIQHAQQAQACLDDACVSDDAADAKAMAQSITERDLAARRAQQASQSGGTVISLALDGIHLQATENGFLSPWGKKFKGGLLQLELTLDQVTFNVHMTQNDVFVFNAAKFMPKTVIAKLILFCVDFELAAGMHMIVIQAGDVVKVKMGLHAGLEGQVIAVDNFDVTIVHVNKVEHHMLLWNFLLTESEAEWTSIQPTVTVSRPGEQHPSHPEMQTEEEVEMELALKYSDCQNPNIRSNIDTVERGLLPEQPRTPLGHELELASHNTDSVEGSLPSGWQGPGNYAIMCKRGPNFGAYSKMMWGVADPLILVLEEGSRMLRVDRNDLAQLVRK